MGRKSEKKVKSDKINALRKQYDAFLEEDKKRKERNEYILGKLDNIRYNSTAVQIRKPIVYGEVYPAYNRISYRPDHRAVQIAHPSEQIHHLNHRQVDVPTTYKDETSLLKEISKKYILIPKLRPSLIDDYVETVPSNSLSSMVQNYGHTPPKKDISNEDWKSKYDILEQLKYNDNGEQANTYNPKEEPVKESLRVGNARKDNVDLNFRNIGYEEEIPEKDKHFIEVDKEAQLLEKPITGRLVEFKESTVSPVEAVKGSVQKIPETDIIHDQSLQSQHISKVENDANLINSQEHNFVTAESNIGNVLPQQVSEVQSEPHPKEHMMQQAEHHQQEVYPQDQYQPQEQHLQEQYPQQEQHLQQGEDLQQEQYPQQDQYLQEQYPQPEQYIDQTYSPEQYAEQQYSQEQYAEQQYSQEQYAEQQYSQEQYAEQQYAQQGQEQYSQEQYPQEQHISQQEESYKDLIPHESDVVYPDPEKVYLDKDDYSPIEVVTPDQLVKEINDEQAVTEIPKDDAEDKYPVELLNTEDFTPAEGVNLKDGENVNPVYLASDNTMDPLNELPIETVKEHRLQPTDNTGIEEFDAEQREMFYTEESDAYAYDQQVVGATEYDQQYTPDENYENNQGVVYYEGADELQQQAYPVEINEHEETSTPYDQNYEQQYMNQYDEQGYQQEQEIKYEAPLEPYEPPQQQEYQYEQPDTVSIENVEKELDREQGFAENQDVGQAENSNVKQTEKA